MTARMYLMPVLEVIADGTTYRGPQHFQFVAGLSVANPSAVDAPWIMMDYGLVDSCLVAADVTTEQHTTVSGSTGVCAAKLDLDQTIGVAALSAVKACIETLKVPAGWVTTDMTYRSVLKKLAGLFQFAQRYHGMHGEALITSAAQLDLTWSAIPTLRQNKIIATNDDLGLPTLSPEPTDTVRQVLKGLADAWGDRTYEFGSILTL